MTDIFRDDSERERVQQAGRRARSELLSRGDEKGWRGHLSASALATATAVSALSLIDRERHAELIRPGVEWLEADQNADGGWGDSSESPSNVPTTVLVSAAFALAGGREAPVARPCWEKAEQYIEERIGHFAGERVEGIQSIYGKDRTFAVPILANLALAGEADPPWWDVEQKVRWRQVPSLPFELACLPRGLFSMLRLHVVSYALPALIAIGELIHDRAPTRNPFKRFIRVLAAGPALRRLRSILPSSGGFLEAVPLTSFVCMSLAATGKEGHEVTRAGTDFLVRMARPDGSWPIDADLATWVTTQSIEALGAGGREVAPELSQVGEELLERQQRDVHPYTGAAPGGWAWTDRPGGVPDVDDTSGALLALARMPGAGASHAARGGVEWLMDIQNDDGGWPTFCRGWGKLPFDRSAPDLTAHALRALNAWHDILAEEDLLEEGARVDMAVERGLDYLDRTQRGDGSWVPLWFGNQLQQNKQNPVYGTARVLMAYRDLGFGAEEQPGHGLAYLVHAQDEGGGWGGDVGVSPSVEETGLAVTALAGFPDSDEAREACRRGALWLADRVEDDTFTETAPIGLYFAELWYSEDLYPVIWTTAALGSLLPEDGRMDQQEED
jgi:squalene-hopene/tetraprenyl-beta-curcumene cyclase